MGRLVRKHYELVNVGLESYQVEELSEQLKNLDRLIKYSQWIENGGKQTEDVQTVKRAYNELLELHYIDEPLENASKIAKILRLYQSKQGCFSACTLI